MMENYRNTAFLQKRVGFQEIRNPAQRSNSPTGTENIRIKRWEDMYLFEA